MSQGNDLITRRQLVAVAAVSLLSPMIRRLPETAAERAGAAAWLAPLAAFPFLLLLLLLISAFFRNKRQGKGLGELILMAGGKVFGRAVLGLYGLWLLFYAGFMLRSGADRLISTVYPSATPPVFVAIMAGMCLIAALGRVCALARCAAVLRPVLFFSLVLVIAFALPDVDVNNLTPVSRLDILPALYAAMPIVNIGGVVMYLGFLEQNVKDGFKSGSFIMWTVALVVIICLMCVATVGIYGADLTVKTPHPFFMMTRSTVIFGTLERIEAVVIAVWVFADFILISALLSISVHVLRLVFAMKPAPTQPQKLFSMKNGRWLTWLCTAAALTGSIAMAPDSRLLAWYSDCLIPNLNTVFAFIIPIAILALGKLRRVL